MKLEKEEIDFIEQIVKITSAFNMDRVIIEQDCIRGIDEDKTVYLNQTQGIPDLSFDSLCVTRVKTFLSRLDIAKSQDNFTMEVKGGGDFVKSLLLSGDRIKIDYRGSDPNVFKVPKTLKDDRATRVDYDTDVVSLIQKGQAAMGEDTITIAGDREGRVVFKLIDINNDVLEHVFPHSAVNVGDGEMTGFNHKYPTKSLMKVLNQKTSGYLEVGGRIGTLSVNLGDLNVYIIPQK